MNHETERMKMEMETISILLFIVSTTVAISVQVSLNMLRLHRILRPNELFHAFPLFSLIQLIPYSKRTNSNFWLTFICWQVICCYVVDVIKKIKKWRNNRVKNQYDNA